MKDILDVITIALGPCDVIDSRDSRMCVLRVLFSLTPRESTIVILRCTGMTLHEIGVNLGVTRERIRQIEAKAYRKLRHPSRSQKFKEFIRKEPRMGSVKNSMLCWNPGTDEVAIVPWPDDKGLSKPYLMTDLAAFAHIHEEESFEKRKTIAFITAVQLIVRDKCDPMAVHNAMIELEEYRHGCADDMPGIYKLREKGDAS